MDLVVNSVMDLMMVLLCSARLGVRLEVYVESDAGACPN